MSLVSVFSALNDEVITRMSIQYGIVSMIGRMAKNPGPRRPRNSPRRSTTARSQAAAIFTAVPTVVATSNVTMATTMAAMGAADW